MKIAIVGSGHIGSTIARALVRAGYEVILAARDFQALAPLVAELDAAASVDRPERAAAVADSIIVATPYGAWPDLGARLAPIVKDKVVIDAANPYPERDGPMAAAALRAGSGLATASYLPGASVAKAFNTLSWKDLRERGSQGLAMAFAADAPDAAELAAMLITALGFEPVRAGGLLDARRFDPGQPAYGAAMDAASLRAALAAVNFDQRGESA